MAERAQRLRCAGDGRRRRRPRCLRLAGSQRVHAAGVCDTRPAFPGNDEHLPARVRSSDGACNGSLLGRCAAGSTHNAPAAAYKTVGTKRPEADQHGIAGCLRYVPERDDTEDQTSRLLSTIAPVFPDLSAPLRGGLSSAREALRSTCSLQRQVVSDGSPCVAFPRSSLSLLNSCRPARRHCYFKRLCPLGC